VLADTAAKDPLTRKDTTATWHSSPVSWIGASCRKPATATPAVWRWPRPAPPHAAEVRSPIAADTELDSAVEQVHTLVPAYPRVLADPVPSVLLDRRAVDALDIVAAFSTADDVAALVKSDLIAPGACGMRVGQKDHKQKGGDEKRL
jgi:hypothetical protein